MSLTERVVRDSKADGKARTIWDRQVMGLGLQITPKGVKNYVIRYKVGNQKRQAIIARVGQITLKDARGRAGAELVRIRNGEVDPLRRREQVAKAPTVNDGLDRFFGEFAPERVRIGRMSPRTVAEYQAQADRSLRRSIGKLKIADVTRDDIVAAVAKRAPVQRNRTLGFASRLFTQFERWEYRAQNANPVRGIERSREEPRDRTLAPSELAALAKALDKAESATPTAVSAIRFAAVTGLRIGEIRAIRWEHVAFETGRLTLPHTKTGRRVHDLPTPAVAILSSLARIGPWAFATGTRGPIGYDGVRNCFQRVAADAGVADVRLHDLRRTVMTQAAAAGVGTHVLRDLLGHKTTMMADRYIRHVGNPVREAREQVGATMAAMMQGETGEVVPLTRRRRRRTGAAHGTLRCIRRRRASSGISG